MSKSRPNEPVGSSTIVLIQTNYCKPTYFSGMTRNDDDDDDDDDDDKKNNNTGFKISTK